GRALPSQNGLQYQVKLHSSDGILRHFNRSRYTADRCISLELRVDFRPHGSDNECWRPPPHHDGMALCPGSSTPWSRDSHQPNQLNPKATDHSTAADWWGRSSAHHLSQSSRSRVHTGRASRLSVLHLSGMG